MGSKWAAWSNKQPENPRHENVKQSSSLERMAEETNGWTENGGRQVTRIESVPIILPNSAKYNLNVLRATKVHLRMRS